jgi:ABC-2 type transport system permease protein
MGKTWALTRIMLKNGTGSPSKTGKAGRLPRFLIPVLIAAAFTPIALLIGKMVSVLYDALAPIGQQGAILGLGLAVAGIVVFMLGIFYVITVFYYSQDIEHLLPLPLKPAQIVTAKFATVLLYEYLTQLAILGPLFVVYGVKSGSGALYVLYAVVVFAVMPIIPLVLGSIVAMVFMSFAGVARNKDRFRLVGGIIAVLASFGLNFFIQRTVNRSMKPEQIQEMFVGGNNALVDLSTRSFPSAKLAANALLESSAWSGLAWLAFFVGVSGLVYVVFAALAERLYFKGVLGVSETSARRVRLSGGELDRRTAQRSALSSLLLKEMRLLLRTPPFFLNCVLMSLMWPVLILIPVLSQPDSQDIFGMVKEMIAAGSGSALVPSIGTALFLFISGSNMTASTSISREGTGYFVLKLIPVPYGTVIAAKAITGWLVTMIGLLLMWLAAWILFGLPAPFALAMLLVGAAAALFTCLTGVMLDLLMPKLVWDNEQRAVKNNVNGLFNLLIAIVVALAMFASAFGLKLGLWGAVALHLVVLIIANAALYYTLKQKGSVWFDRIGK